MNILTGLKRTAVLCILNNSDNYLLLKRSKEPNINNYTPVGGKLEPFENPNDAITREVLEETGIKLDKIEFCGVLVESSPTEYNWTSFVYKAEIPMIEPPKCNEGILEWVKYRNIDLILTPSTDRFIYNYILKRKSFVMYADYDDSNQLLFLKDELLNKVLYQDDNNI